MTYLLAIESATPTCSVALSKDGQLYERYSDDRRKHAENILQMIDSIMTEADCQPQQIDALVFGAGPGSFLGTRLALTVAQGLGFSWKKPLVAVPTLDALAFEAAGESTSDSFAVAWDARMESIYFATYESSERGVVALQKASILKPEELDFDAIKDAEPVGNGWSVYRDRYEPAVQEKIDAAGHEKLDRSAPKARFLLPGGEELLLAGKSTLAEDASVTYLRDPVRA